MTTYIILGIIAFLLIIAYFSYNSLIGARNMVEKAFGDVDSYLKKRYDLIPNLVETLKAYMKHEHTTLTEITALRSQAVSGNLTPAQKIDIENKVSGMVHSLLISVERYPDLKASDQFIQLERNWADLEEYISAARRYYNSAVNDYNNTVEKFPSNIVGRIMGFQHKKMIEIPDIERQNISAKNLFAS